jgi:hypothetical protein
MTVLKRKGKHIPVRSRTGPWDRDAWIFQIFYTSSLKPGVRVPLKVW